MRILITGATGLVGSEITRQCHAQGINVNFLTTSKGKIEKSETYRGYYWNPSSGEIDVKCLEGVGAIINLAGASVFQPWTDSNKKKILNSRIESLNLLYKTLKENSHEVGQLISASAIGIYPSSRSKMYEEDDNLIADDFLGEVSEKWEAAADKFEDLKLRVAKVRIGIVLSADGGALPQIMKPVKFNLGASLGSGKQWQSWIHVRDLARIFLYIISNGLTGIYNGVAPNPATNEELTKEVAYALDKKLWLPKVPGLALKAAMGEMSSVVLGSQLVSSGKIQDEGFDFHFVNLRPAIQDLLNKKPG
ncbi:TIGR01777 family oxidoreductase [Salinimicrobium sediminilitoris]|uniref:TIGR01777 family oxidoreductase n=1 Tax=Salinimicrobium sediminilitoris TaxID=2876715 RepID=UPI001E2B0463|nr:TIGR01777 family oxidoreductase [Salinimicrobium sediminilitoris]MCC8358424.1 TIGR01777 family oxidoreductase [Salinimicrobium sediminilitoris]